MKWRCYYPKNNSFPRYGGRGITVCDRWKNSFENFLSDMGIKPKGTSLDRIDSTKGYLPENCRWATFKQQANNTKANVRLTHNGKTLTLTEWAEEIKINPKTLWTRLFMYKWTTERALTQKLKVIRKWR